MNPPQNGKSSDCADDSKKVIVKFMNLLREIKNLFGCVGENVVHGNSVSKLKYLAFETRALTSKGKFHDKRGALSLSVTTKENGELVGCQ